jgi:hypothetical protein
LKGIYLVKRLTNQSVSKWSEELIDSLKNFWIE